MMRGLWRLTWLEIKIFMREPMGVFGTVGLPVLIFVVLGRVMRGAGPSRPPGTPRFLSGDLPILAAILIAVSALLSLVAIVSIYREGGILKRLRATPLTAGTILTAHVIVKLLFTLVTLVLMIAAGRRFYPIDPDVPLMSFAVALLFTTANIMSLGFVIASMVPTARFAQPIATMIVYPMLGLSGLFLSVDALPPAVQVVARLLPLTYAVSLLQGIWHGEGWMAHLGDAGVLVLTSLVLTSISARVFRWE
jgi:ABC-2 type transport system permease protein